jgi:AcrR family transcriptional regulator
VDSSVLQATREILDQVGYLGLTMVAVAQRAGVTKPTVYLRWPTKLQLVAEAIAEVWDLGSLPDTGTLRGDLLALLKLFIRGFSQTPAGRALESLIADLHDYPDLMIEFRHRYFEPRWGCVETVLNRAIARGEIANDVNFELLTDLLVGPIYYRVLARVEPPCFKLLQEAVDLILAGLEAQRSRPSGRRAAAAKNSSVAKKKKNRPRKGTRG